MSVYEYVIVEATKEYSREEIIKHLKDLGCISYPKKDDGENYDDVMLSPEFINMANGIVRMPFYIPRMRVHKWENKDYDIMSVNKRPLPQVVFEWISRNFSEDIKITWQIETTTLFHGMIKNYYKSRNIKKNWLEDEALAIKARREGHEIISGIE